MAEEDRRISLAGKVLVDTIDAQLLEVQKQGQVVASALPSPWRVDFTAATNARPRPTSSTAKTSRGSSVSCSMRRPTPFRRGAIRYSASSDWRWTSNAESHEAPLPEAMVAAWARRLVWPAFYGSVWSQLGCRADLRFLRTGRDRSCSLHSPACRSGVYLACSAATSADGAGMLWAKVTHRAPDERRGLGGRRVRLRPHKSPDDPTEPQTLDSQPVTHDRPEPQQLPIGGGGEIFAAKGHRPCFANERYRSCRGDGRGCGGIRCAVVAFGAAARGRRRQEAE